MLSYLLPTHNRPDRLQRTLRALAGLDAAAHEAIGGAEVIVVDNASNPPVTCPGQLCNGMPVRVVHRPQNEGAAARNIGVHESSGEWVVMLDDDSHPTNAKHVEVLLQAGGDIAAIGAEIWLPNGQREAGGLPEVFIGCGVAIRRSAFVDVGGYDPTFDYYAEEYDLCAKLILNGWRIEHDLRFRVVHEKTSAGRDMNRIVHRLVRNNCWAAQRYAPAQLQSAELAETVSRYARIAMKEHASSGLSLGMAEALQTLHLQPRREMAIDFFDRFTGLAHVRQTLADDARIKKAACVGIVEPGKNAWAVAQTLNDMGVQLVDDPDEAEALVVGTLSPGPMLDAFDRYRKAGLDLILPWQPRSLGQGCSAESKGEQYLHVQPAVR